MSFLRYPKYKVSGVEWLGEVPAHWEVVKVRWLCEIKKRIVGELGFDVLSITQKGIRVKDTESNDGQLSMDYTKYQLVEVGDFAMNHMDLLTGYVDLSSIVGVTSPDYRVFSIRDPSVCHPKYVLYLLQNGYLNKVFFAFGQGSSQLGRWRLHTDQLNDFWFPLPSPEEQCAIATFLDNETAKIDALVAEQEKLIALLQEKRQAVISHAVTKGLDPSVTMKDSGVEWLGEVSVHWEVCALRRVIAAIEQGWSPECYAREAEEQEWGVLKAGCLNGGNFRPSENKALPPELPPEEAYEVRVGDVLMSRASGSPELVGSTALVKATRERLMLSDKIFRLKLKEFVNAAFFVAALNSRPLRIQIENALSGGNGMANNLPQSSLLTFAMAVPPLAEQATITVFLEQETAKLDTLTAEARSAITLLQERRTALISAAVTGQIDVRGLTGGANTPDSVAASAYPASA